MTSGLSFRLFGTPFRAQLWFFITLVLVGIRALDNFVSAPIFKTLLFVLMAAAVGIIFIVHELGHVYAYRRYGQRASVMLWGLGGITFGESRLPPRKKIVVTLSGLVAPVLVLVLPVYLLRSVLPLPSGGPFDLPNLPYEFMNIVFWGSIIWTAVNFLPILPLDGGHLVESALEWRTGDRQRMQAHFVSWVAAGICALIALLIVGDAMLALMALVLGFFNFMPWYQDRNNLPQTMRFLPDEDEGGYYEGDSSRGSVVSMKEAKKKRDKRSPAELVKDGYDALERRDYRAALRITDRLGEKRTNAELDRWTAEVAAFAWLGDRNPVKAEEVLAALPRNVKLSQPLVATMALAGKRTDEAMRLMVDSMVNEPEGGPKVVAVDLFAEYGMIHRLARELVDQPGGKGFEAAVALEGMLHRLHRTQDASTVSDVILLG